MLTNARRDNQIKLATDWLDELSTIASDAMAYCGPLDYEFDGDDAGDIHDAIGELANIAGRAFEDLKRQLAEIETLKLEQAVSAGRPLVDPNREHRTHSGVL